VSLSLMWIAFVVSQVVERFVRTRLVGNIVSLRVWENDNLRLTLFYYLLDFVIVVG
jgi:hypothetical protein